MALDPSLIDEERHAVKRGDRWHHLNRKEWDIFCLLRARPGKLVRRDAIFDHLYGADPNGGPLSNTIEVSICTLRRKCPFEIATVYCCGYILAPEARGAIHG